VNNVRNFLLNHLLFGKKIVIRGEGRGGDVNCFYLPVVWIDKKRTEEEKKNYGQKNEWKIICSFFYFFSSYSDILISF
jgi:hypothetical protein